jgi:hypothetical protein
MWRWLLLAGVTMVPNVFGASAAVVTLGEELCHTVHISGGWRLFDYDQLDRFRERAAGPVRGDRRAKEPLSPVVSQHLEVSGTEPREGDDYVYRQKAYRKSGPRWPVTGDEVRISPDEKWIAVQSWEGTDYRDGASVLPGAPLLDLTGRFFIDLYDVKSGERVISLDGVDHDFTSGDAPLHSTFWLETNFFVVPLGTSREKLLVCEMPAAIPSDSTH